MTTCLRALQGRGGSRSGHGARRWILLAAAMMAGISANASAGEPIALTAAGFGATAFPVGDFTDFNKLYLPFRQSGGEFTFSKELVSSPGAGKPYAYQYELQYGAFGGSTPTLRLTTAASGNGIVGNGASASVHELYAFSVDSIVPLPAEATKVAVELPVRVSLLATQLPPGPPDLNTVSQITATITRTEGSFPAINYLLNVAACLNITLPICATNSLTFETVLQFDVNPNAENRLHLSLGASVGLEADGHFDGFAHGSIDPLPRLSLTADPEAYGLPPGSKFSDYYTLRFSPNLYTVAQLPVPEPSAWLLCLLGLGAVTLAMWKPSKKEGLLGARL